MPLLHNCSVFLAGLCCLTGFLSDCPSVLASTPASVTISGNTSVPTGQTAQLAAKVSNSTSQAVVWIVNQVVGGTASAGTISNGGLYTAPKTIPNFTVTIEARSSAYSYALGHQVETIVNPPPTLATASAVLANASTNAYLIDARGSNLLSGASIQIGAEPVASYMLSATELRGTFTSTAAQAGHTIAIEIVNPNSGTATSNAVSVMLAAAPTALATSTSAARFLDQATFGSSDVGIAHVQQIGLQAALQEQFKEPTTLYSQPTASEPGCSGYPWRCNQSDFLKIAIWAPDQLRQRVAMALSEIWVAPSVFPNYLPFYLNTLANDSFTNYRTIMQDVTLTPAMGTYLSMVNSLKPATGQIANENYGRELMQLFCLGPNRLNEDGSLQTDQNGNPVPVYTQTQVEAFARAFTGWTYANADGSTPSGIIYNGNPAHALVAVSNEHDTSAKELLDGTTLPAGQSAAEDLNGALDDVFNDPNIGPFVCRQLIQHLVTSSPSAAYVQRVSAVFANDGADVRGDMKSVLTAIFMDPEARAGDTQTAYQADWTPSVNGGRLREPLVWIANLFRGLDATNATPSVLYPFVGLMGDPLAAMGESPFTQQSVFGYFSPSFVIPQTSLNAPEFGLETSSSIMPRANLADRIVHSYPNPLVNIAPTSVLGTLAMDPTQLVDYLSMVFMHNQMPTDMQSAIVSAVGSLPAANPSERAAFAAYLVVTSPQYKVIH
jgi:hypothetical protein